MIKAIALLTPIYVALFWGIVFLVQKGSTSREKFQLSIVMFFAFGLYFSHAVFFSNLFHLYSLLEGVYIFSMLSIYPMYYIYVLMLTTKKITIKRYILHLLPAIIFGILSIVTTFILTHDERIFYVQDTLMNKNLKGLNWSTVTGIKGHFFMLGRVALIIQILFYVVSSLKLVSRHNKRVSDYFSDIEGKTLNWVRNLNIVILIVSVSSIVFAFIGRSYFVQNEFFLLIPSAIFSIIIFDIGLKGNQQLQFTTEFLENIDIERQTLQNETNQEDNELKSQLIQLFEETKIYKNSDLRITTISESLKTNRTYISRLINDEFNVNFNEFVNKYRIAEAKNLLGDKANNMFTMEHIAEKSGFGSLNSFTRVFKEFEGFTPGKYKVTKVQSTD